MWRQCPILNTPDSHASQIHTERPSRGQGVLEKPEVFKGETSRFVSVLSQEMGKQTTPGLKEAERIESLSHQNGFTFHFSSTQRKGNAFYDRFSAMVPNSAPNLWMLLINSIAFILNELRDPSLNNP